MSETEQTVLTFLQPFSVYTGSCALYSRTYPGWTKISCRYKSVMKISGCIMVVNQMLKTSDNFSQPVLDAISVSRKVSRKYHPGYWFQQHKGLCSAAQNHLHICRLCLFFFFFHFSLTVHISPPALCTSLCNPPLWDYFQQSLTSHWKCSLVITCNSAYLQKELAGWCTTEPEGNKLERM